MYFFLKYQGVDKKGTDCPIWCDVSFPVFDNSKFESYFLNKDRQALNSLTNAEVFFHHSPIGFDFFNQHKDIYFCSSRLIDVFRRFNVKFFSIPINAYMQPKKNGAKIKTEKDYFIVIFESIEYSVDFDRSLLRVERNNDGKLVFDTEKRKNIVFV